MQGNRVDSRLLVVGSQTTNLTPDLSFGHNLCFRYPNGSCEPILNIYISIFFQWYKEFFNPLSFWPLQSLFEHPRVHWDSNSQGGSSLGSAKVHSLTLSFTPKLPLLARNLVSPCFSHKPKARVTTHTPSKGPLVYYPSIGTSLCSFGPSLLPLYHCDFCFSLILFG